MNYVKINEIIQNQIMNYPHLNTNFITQMTNMDLNKSQAENKENNSEANIISEKKDIVSSAGEQIEKKCDFPEKKELGEKNNDNLKVCETYPNIDDYINDKGNKVENLGGNEINSNKNNININNFNDINKNNDNSTGNLPNNNYNGNYSSGYNYYSNYDKNLKGNKNYKNNPKYFEKKPNQYYKNTGFSSDVQNK